MKIPSPSTFQRAAFLAFAAFGLIQPAHAGCDTDVGASTLRVDGESVVSAPANMVLISVSVANTDLGYDKAIARTQTTSDEIINGVSAGGVPAADLHVDTLTVQPEYDTNIFVSGKMRTRRERFLGYQAISRFRITLRDLSKYQGVLKLILRDSSVELLGIEFRNSENRKYQDQAREAAVKAAREKAVLMSGALGQTIGKAIKLEEEGDGGDAPRMDYLGRSNTSGYADTGAASTQAPESSVQYRVKVCAAFELK